jgi:hypothetical protein
VRGWASRTARATASGVEKPPASSGRRHPSTTGDIQPGSGSPTSSISRPSARMSARGSGSPVPSASPGPMTLGVNRERPPTRNTCSGGSADTTTPRARSSVRTEQGAPPRPAHLVLAPRRTWVARSSPSRYSLTTKGRPSGDSQLDLPGEVGVLQPLEDLRPGLEDSPGVLVAPAGSVEDTNQGLRTALPRPGVPGSTGRPLIELGQQLVPEVRHRSPSRTVMPSRSISLPEPTLNVLTARRRARWPTLRLLSHSPPVPRMTLAPLAPSRTVAAPDGREPIFTMQDLRKVRGGKDILKGIYRHFSRGEDRGHRPERRREVDSAPHHGGAGQRVLRHGAT